jgi:flagellar protein FlbB
VAIPKIPTSVIITCLIFALIGALWGTHVAGLLDLTQALAHLPIVGKYFEKEANETIAEISPLEEENDNLKETVQMLQAQLADYQMLEYKYQAEITSLENKIVQLENQLNAEMEKEANHAKVVDFYREMKPKEIAPILENLDDDRVIDILIRLESSHAAKILAELDPLRAAKLFNLLTDNH